MLGAGSLTAVSGAAVAAAAEAERFTAAMSLVDLLHGSPTVEQQE